MMDCYAWPLSTKTVFDDGGLRMSEATAGDYFELLKPRVMSLVVFTAFVGLVAAPGHHQSGPRDHRHPGDRGRRRRLRRAQHVVRRRYRRGHDPHGQPSGAVGPHHAGRGAGLRPGAFGAFGDDARRVGQLAAASLLAFTIFFYAVVYTMWLKRWTPQNIVIGGAAGAFPPMIGWAAVTGRSASKASSSS